MCYYIGIEDLAANAMIQILEREPDKYDGCENSLEISFKTLEDYGTKVVKVINGKSDEKAILILSRASTEYMFRNYSDYFEEVEDENAIKLREGKTVEDLKERFRTYRAKDLIKAYMDISAVQVLESYA